MGAQVPGIASTPVAQFSLAPQVLSVLQPPHTTAVPLVTQVFLPSQLGCPLRIFSVFPVHEYSLTAAPHAEPAVLG